jgi:hypothetical protein
LRDRVLTAKRLANSARSARSSLACSRVEVDQLAIALRGGGQLLVRPIIRELDVARVAQVLGEFSQATAVFASASHALAIGVREAVEQRLAESSDGRRPRTPLSGQRHQPFDQGVQLLVHLRDGPRHPFGGPRRRQVRHMVFPVGWLTLSPTGNPLGFG